MFLFTPPSFRCYASHDGITIVPSSLLNEEPFEVCRSRSISPFLGPGFRGARATLELNPPPLLGGVFSWSPTHRGIVSTGDCSFFILCSYWLRNLAHPLLIVFSFSGRFKGPLSPFICICPVLQVFLMFPHTNRLVCPL